MTPPSVAAPVPTLPINAADAPVPGRVATIVADVASLVRPRIAVMVLATVIAAAWLVAGVPRDLTGFALVLVGTAAVAASSSIANQILERDADRLMRRTAARPIASGRLDPVAAAAVAAVALLGGTAAIVWGGGWPAAAVAATTWALYVGVYTPLKRVSPLNTAVGAIAGALPVGIGWCAAGGATRIAEGDATGTLAVAALGTVLYLWQFPHFMAIAWLYRRQYEAAGMRMLTVVDPSGLRAAGQALAAALAMIPVSLVLAVPSGSVRMFLAAAVSSIVYALATVRFAIRRDDGAARTLLFTSLGSLLGVLAAAIAFGRPL